MAGAFGLLVVFWIAIWVLDFGYYNRLLVGAVRALRAIEAGGSGNPSDVMDGITLSTEIERAVEGKPPLDTKAAGSANDIAGGRARKWFYGIVLTGLVLGVCVSLWLAYLARGDTPRMSWL